MDPAHVRTYNMQQPWGTLHRLRRSVRRWSKSWSDNKVNEQLIEWISTLKPDVIHLHHLDGIPWKWLIDGKQQDSYRLWLTLHDYAIPCAEDNYYIDSFKCVRDRIPNGAQPVWSRG